MLQAPGTLLLTLGLVLIRRWVPLPLWLIALLVLAWIVKDALLYPLLRQAYELDGPVRSNTILGERAIARERLAPSGFVRVRGELWRAELPAGESVVEEGGAVRVVGSRGMTLLVEREED